MAAKGEQLTARRAYQQGLDAHTEAAKQFQIAAQATSDITAAKALLLQRDQQLKLVQEVQRKVDRGKDHAARSSAPTPQRYGPPGSPRSRETVTARQQSQPLHGANPIERLPGAAKYAAAGNVARQSSLTQSYAPRERVEASMMADSRYSRRSNSPSQSMMSTATPYHGSSAQGSGSSGVEESYYLLRSEVSEYTPKAETQLTTFAVGPVRSSSSLLIDSRQYGRGARQCSSFRIRSLASAVAGHSAAQWRGPF